jgi:hypothetical protein
MKYKIKTLEMTKKNPIVAEKIGPMAPNKPFVNKGSDEIAVYPSSGSLSEAVKVMPGKWALLPPNWSQLCHE